MRSATLHGQDGFTMVEMLIALSIFLLILMGVFQIFEPTNAAYVSSERKLGVQQNARIAMDMMVRQIRTAGFFPENLTTDTTDDVANPVGVQIATNAALAVAGDLDGSCATLPAGPCAGASKAFVFCLDNSGLGLRRVNAVLNAATGVAASYVCSGGDLLAESVTSLGFAYYDANNNPIPSPPALDGQPAEAVPALNDTTQRSVVRRVVITLTARESVPNQPAQTYTLTSDVRLRNP